MRTETQSKITQLVGKHSNIRIRQTGPYALEPDIHTRRPKLHRHVLLFCLDLFPMAQQTLVGQGLLILETSRSHSDKTHSVWLLWTSDRPNAGTSTRQHQRDIHTSGGIWTRNTSKPQWPRGLRRRSSAARLLRLWVRIPPGAWIFVCCEWVCCQVEVYATDWSLVQRSPTDCGASLCVIKKARKRGG